MRALRHLYLAGPFFNDREIDVMDTMEGYADAAMESGSITGYFSPRKHGGNETRQGDIKHNARAIFDANFRAIEECGEVIAVLDRQYADGTSIALIRNQVDTVDVIKDNLTQPDLGTVWEMGAAHALRKRVIGFTLRPRGEGVLNLMISQSCLIVLHGWKEYSAWLNCGTETSRFIRDHLLKHEGRVWSGFEE